MDLKKLKKILLKHYAEPSIYPKLRQPCEKGFTPPSYEKAYRMFIEDNISMEVWMDIGKYLKEEEKKSQEQGEQPLIDKAS